MSGLVSCVEAVALPLLLRFGASIVAGQVAFEWRAGLVGIGRAGSAIAIEPGTAAVIVVIGEDRSGTTRTSS